MAPPNAFHATAEGQPSPALSSISPGRKGKEGSSARTTFDVSGSLFWAATLPITAQALWRAANGGWPFSWPPATS
eukprot:1647114-Pyramimonas_sp.AAC.1